MVPKGHRFARKRSIATVDVLTESLAVFSRKEYAIYHKWLRSLFGARTKSIRLSEECDSGPSLIAAVQSGRGIAVCSEGHITLAGSRVVFIPFLPAPQPVEIGISYARRALPSPTRQIRRLQ
jgi:DNA-binding transcriptional LysR family regulator